MVMDMDMDIDVHHPLATSPATSACHFTHVYFGNLRAGEWGGRKLFISDEVICVLIRKTSCGWDLHALIPF